MRASRISIPSVSRPTLIGFAIIMVLVFSAPFFGGWDFLHSVRPDTLTWKFTYTYNPLPAYWFFYPFAILPPLAGYMAWNLANAAGVILAVRYWKSSLLAFSLSIPCFWMFYAGQYDGFFAGGLVLAAAANPWLAGFGLFVLTFKPQVGLIPILFLLLKRRDWRMLVIPAGLYLLSFVVYGWWVPWWLGRLKLGYDTNLLTPVNISMFPIGLVLLLLLFRYRDSLKIWMLAGTLAVPYFAVYSLASFFTVEAPAWWFNLSLWAFYLAFAVFKPPYYVTEVMFIFPLILLLMEIRKYEKARSTAKQTAAETGMTGS